MDRNILRNTFHERADKLAGLSHTDRYVVSHYRQEIISPFLLREEIFPVMTQKKRNKREAERNKKNSWLEQISCFLEHRAAIIDWCSCCRAKRQQELRRRFMRHCLGCCFGLFFFFHFIFVVSSDSQHPVVWLRIFFSVCCLKRTSVTLMCAYAYRHYKIRASSTSKASGLTKTETY